MKKLLLIFLLFTAGCCTVCPDKNMVLRGFNQDGKLVWFYLPKGAFSAEDADEYIMTPEEARKEQEKWLENENQKYGI